MGDSYIRLSAPGVYIPERGKNDCNVITNADLEKIVDTSDEWIVSRTGMSERRISFDKNILEMADEAVLDLYAQENLNPDEVRFATNRHYKKIEFPNSASYIAGKYGWKIATSDKGAGCTGLIFDIRDSYNTLMVEKEKREILTIGAENLTDMTNYADRNTCVLFGDGVVAHKVERIEGRGEGIIKCWVGGEPDLGDKDWKNGFLTTEKTVGLKLRPNPVYLAGDLTQPKFETYEAEQDYLIMNGKEVFKFAVPSMQHAVHKVLEDTGYTLRDVDLIIPHGANQRIINAAVKGLIKPGEDGSEEKQFRGQVFSNLERFGNLSTASTGVSMDEAIRTGRLKPGMLYLLVSFGAGLTYGAILARHN